MSFRLVVCLLLVPGALRGQSTEGGPAEGVTVRLDLAEAIGMAVDRSHSVRAQRLSATAAAARVDERRSALLPHLSLSAQHSARTFNTSSFGLDFPALPGQEPLFDPGGEVVGPVGTVDVRAQFSQTVFDWNAITRVRGARASVEVGEAHVDALREVVATEAARSYVQAVRAEGQLEAREADVGLAETLLDGARSLLESGVGVRLDVTRTEAQLASLQVQLVTARNEAERARLALLRAVNLPPDANLILTDTIPDPVPPREPTDPEAHVAVALSRRADLREMERRIDAARLEVAAVRAERLPTLSVVAGDGFTGDRYGRLLNTYEWGVQVSVPVFEGSRLAAREDEQDAVVASLLEQRREMEAEVAFSVRDALLRLEAARQLEAASEVRLELAQAEVDQSRERLEAGVAGTADVATALLRLNEARTARVDARAAHQSARIALAAAEGSVAETIR